MLAYLRNDRVIMLILSAVYLITRLYNLTVLPIFTDESIYIYWSKYILDTHSHWFIALTDGKPPILTWIIGILLGVLPQSWYLVAGRLPSVFFGLISLIGTFKLSQLLFGSRKAAFLASVFLLLSPFMFVYDRLALYDAQLCAMLVWSVYFCIKTSKSLSVKDALLWAIFLGLGFLSKPPAVLYLLITPLCFLVMMKAKTIFAHWKRITLFLLSVLLISEGMNNLQRVSGAFQAAQLKNQQFEQPLQELIRHPFQLLPSNLYQFTIWLLGYYTLPLFLAVIVSFGVIILTRRREGFALFFLWALPILAFAFAAREIFPRYLLFITPFAMITLSWALVEIWRRGKVQRTLSLGVASLLLVLPTIFCFFLLTDPKQAPLPLADYNQLVAEHPSGYGLDRVFSYIRLQELKGDLTVVTQGTFGLYPYAFYLEFWGDPHVRILPKWPLDKLDAEIYQAREKGEVIVILKDVKVMPLQLSDLVLIEKIVKPRSIKYPIFLTRLK
ncbi:MAG: glycosyltransferase family 39 protein [bacterium]|nr:glycosyltransferase family 39 protein [bacterium]